MSAPELGEPGPGRRATPPFSHAQRASPALGRRGRREGASTSTPSPVTAAAPRPSAMARRGRAGGQTPTALLLVATLGVFSAAGGGKSLRAAEVRGGFGGGRKSCAQPTAAHRPATTHTGPDPGRSPGRRVCVAVKVQAPMPRLGNLQRGACAVSSGVVQSVRNHACACVPHGGPPPACTAWTLPPRTACTTRLFMLSCRVSACPAQVRLHEKHDRWGYGWPTRGWPTWGWPTRGWPTPGFGRWCYSASKVRL
jgi:hypothetical protein